MEFSYKLVFYVHKKVVVMLSIAASIRSKLPSSVWKVNVLGFLGLVWFWVGWLVVFSFHILLKKVLLDFNRP